MKYALLLLTITALTWGQSKQAKQSVEAPAITASDAQDTAPHFPRKYLVRLTSKPDLMLTVQCADSDYESLGRSCDGTVRQPDEKAVFFRVSQTGYLPKGDTVAEHIFDPVIVPELKRLSKQIADQDAAYRAAWPYQFKDKNGQVWVKAPK